MHGYSARMEQMYADERKERFREKRRFTESIKRKIIRELTEDQWSPEQIVGKARKKGNPWLVMSVFISLSETIK
ncbi:hypothetical protein EZS27_038979 [termite gut metagenome]|uniref:Uncharacterized protein n=1 Tax=termite gut metagenome TaxID=433724 RepID=A0A5J4PJ89_9ZZZZ